MISITTNPYQGLKRISTHTITSSEGNFNYYESLSGIETLNTILTRYRIEFQLLRIPIRD